MKFFVAMILAVTFSACDFASEDSSGSSSAESVSLNDAARRASPALHLRLSAGTSAYETAGPEDGQPVVLVHGVSGPMSVWDLTYPFLVQAGYRVLRYDLYGRGLSDRVDVDYSQDLFDRQLLDLLDALQMTKPVVLVGSSMGGVVVAEFRNRHPERVAKVALLDPAGFPMKTPAVAKVIDIPLIGELVMEILGDKLLRERNRSYFYRPERFTEAIAAYETQLVFKGTRKAMLSTWRHMPLQSFKDSYAAVAASGTPVLLIWGEKDEAIPYANAKAAKEILTGCDFVSIKDAGHLPQLEEPDTVNASLSRFLAK